CSRSLCTSLLFLVLPASLSTRRSPTALMLPPASEPTSAPLPPASGLSPHHPIPAALIPRSLLYYHPSLAQLTSVPISCSCSLPLLLSPADVPAHDCALSLAPATPPLATPSVLTPADPQP